MGLRPQFLVDAKGKRTSVLLTIKDYQELLERAQDLIDAELIDEVRKTSRVSWATVKGKRRKRSPA